MSSSVSAACLTFTLLFVPEMKGRILYEMQPKVTEEVEEEKNNYKEHQV